MPEKLILGRYRPVSRIGSGGFAEVSLAWDTRLQRRVAIKSLKLDEETAAMVEGADDVSAYDLDRIPGLAEARTAAMFQDPNIAGVLDFGVKDGFAYFIMEYVDGITLADLLAEFQDYITLDVVAAVFAGVAHALDVAHANQVLHLDIKPGNILINHQGEVKVTDFGLAELSGSSGFSKATGGTIGYMPLEQMRLEPLDARCDEWALASVVYEMLTGHNPFLADDLVAAQAAIEQADILLPSICRPELDEEADEVIFYALDPEKGERYDSVADFAEELQPFLGNIRRGTRQLAHLVGEAKDDCKEGEEEEEAVMASRGGKIPGLAIVGRAGKLLSSDTFIRILGAVSCGLMAYLAFEGNLWLEGLPVFALPIALAVLCVAGYALPHLGALLCMVALAAAFASQASYFCAVLAAVPAIVWWVMLGRRGIDEAAIMTAPASLGSFGCAAVSPLAGGLNLNVKQALGNTAASLCLAVVLATLSSQQIAGWDILTVFPSAASRFNGSDQVLFSMVVQPGFWITAASWLLATGVVALFSGEGGMVRRSLGLVAGAALLAAGSVANMYLSSAGAVLVPPISEILVFVSVVAISFAYCIARPHRG